MKGKVKWWNESKGFGFICGDDGEDYFGHFTDIVGMGYKVLHEDQVVSFDVRTQKYGPQATNITLEPVVDDEIPNCPCCGSKAKYESKDISTPRDDDYVWVHTVKCTQCSINTGGLGSKEAAIRVWSKRV